MNTDKLTIYPLGSAGWIPSNGLETVCFAFIRNDEIFILDAGTGISRLLWIRNNLLKQEWSKLKKAHIFLTHYHFDHSIGIFWIRGIFPAEFPVTIYAPGVASCGKSASELLTREFSKPYSPYGIDQLIPGVEIIDLTPPKITVESGTEKIRVRLQLNPEHSDPSVSFRFEDWFAYVTDTTPKDETVEFVRAVEVLLHESYFDSYEQYEDENDPLGKHRSGPHTGSFGAGLIAKRAGVKMLYLMHHNPEISMDEIDKSAKQVREILGVDCRAARDLGEITCSGKRK